MTIYAATLCRNEKNSFLLGGEDTNFELFKWKSKKSKEIAAQFQIGKTANSCVINIVRW